MKKLFIALSLLPLSGNICAETVNEGSELLIFLKSGKIEKLHSSKIAKIELSKLDTDSVEQTDYCTQEYHFVDNKMLRIPIELIDSVAFGNRVIKESKSGVRKLSDEEAASIVSFNGTSLSYKYGAPLILRDGEIVYYDRVTEIMPYGLCAEVNSQTSSTEATTAKITELTVDQVFDRYLVTGDEINATDVSRPNRIHEIGDNPRLFEQEINTEMSGITCNAKLQAEIGGEVSDIVVDALAHYYHAKIRLYFQPKFALKFLTEGSFERNYVTDNGIQLGVKGGMGLISATIDLRGFFDMLAEIGVEYDLEAQYSTTVEWTRLNGKDTFTDLELRSENNAETTQHIHSHLKGELFTGLMADLSLGAVFDRIGAGFEWKIGPKLEADFGLGAIQSLSERYDQEVYGRAKIGLSLHAEGLPYLYHLDHWLWGRRQKTYYDAFKPQATLRLSEWHLFPEFSTRAVLSSGITNFSPHAEKQKVVSASTYSTTDVVCPLEVNFGLSDKKSDQMLFVGDMSETLKSGSQDNTQVFYSELAAKELLSSTDIDEILCHPIFKYLDYTIKARPAGIADGIAMTPLNASMSASGRYFVMGMIPVGQRDVNETTYIIGNVMPIGQWPGDNHRKPTTNVIIIDNGSNSSTSITGTWNGVVKDKKIVLTFDENSNGYFDGENFEYSVNLPFAGYVSLKFDNGLTLNFQIVELANDKLKMRLKGSGSIYELTKV